MRVECLTKRWLHHTSSGGYDRLAQELGGGIVSRRPDPGFFSRMSGKVWRKLSSTGDYLLDYRYEDLQAEWKIFWQARSKQSGVVHVLYGDEQLDLLLRMRRLLGRPLVATFHLPASRVIKRFEESQKDLLTGLDAAVVVSRSQLADFRRWLGSDKVVYIPHGIDTKVFTPKPQLAPANKVRLVMVGFHMRDWEASHKVIDECNRLNLLVEFDVVAPKQYWPYFTGCDNTRLHSGISEGELINLYHQADALLALVLEATANNAALESLACGTPVISNAVGGIPDYVDDTCGWLFEKNEVSQVVKLIARFCAERGYASSLSKGARQKSFEFDWQQVASQMRAVYQAVADGGMPVKAVTAWDQNPSPA